MGYDGGKGKGYGGKGWGGYGEDEMYWMFQQCMMMKGKKGMKGKGKSNGGKGKSWDEGGGPKKKKKSANGEQHEKSLPGGENAPFRARLNQAMQHKFKGDPAMWKIVNTRGFISYTTEGEHEEHMSQCVCEHFQGGQSYSSEGPAATTRQAEENAASQAMQAEFPELYHSAPAKIKELAADLTMRPEVAPKRSLLEAVSDPAEEGKQKLNVAFQIMIGRSLRKGEVEYTLEEDGDAVQGTVTINCFPGEEPAVFAGEPVQGTSNASKREANNNAAEQALKAYKDEIEAAIPVYEAKKAANIAEEEAKKHERIAQNLREEAEARVAAAEPAFKKFKTPGAQQP